MRQMMMGLVLVLTACADAPLTENAGAVQGEPAMVANTDDPAPSGATNVAVPVSSLVVALSGDGLQLVDGESGKTYPIAFGTAQQQTLDSIAKALLEMSTPVTPIWEGILLLPLLGIIDSGRTQDVMNKTLTKIAETRAKVFVLDISGVGTVDTAVANQLIKITQATQLMGCESIISGISPAVARTIVELGVKVGEVKTTATLRDAFEMALKSTGVDIRQLSRRRQE